MKPEYQEEYERLESELERFYNIYVEKFSNIDYLEYELDKYNLQEVKRRKEDQKVIENLQMNQKRAENEEIFNDDDEDRGRGGKKDDIFNEMRETRTGFGAKGQGGRKDFKAEGGLQPDDDDEDDEDVGEDEEEEDDGGEGVDVEDDEEDEGSDHNF